MASLDSIIAPSRFCSATRSLGGTRPAPPGRGPPPLPRDGAWPLGGASVRVEVSVHEGTFRQGMRAAFTVAPCPCGSLVVYAGDMSVDSVESSCSTGRAKHGV